jgi:hypothetical protein
MKYLFRIFSLPLFVFTISLFITIPVLAIPSLPSSFYGKVKVNNANVPDGTAIQALIGGQVYGQGVTQTYQGDSVYILDVPGDNADTAAQDGGREGDTIQFKIGGVPAKQTAVWHVGTNANLNLTASSSSGIISTPAPTSSPVPTQTAIVPIQPTQIPTLQVATEAAQPSPALPSNEQPSPTPSTAKNETMNNTNYFTGVTVLVLIFVTAIIIGYLFFYFRRKKI